MVYSEYFHPRQTKIPIPIGLVLILVILIFIAHLFSSTPIPSKASRKNVNQLSIVNPSNNEIGIYWQTDNKETGWVIYGESQGALNTIALDFRDVSENKNSFRNHFVDIKDLTPNTSYFYKVVSDNQLVTESNGSPFKFETSSESAPASISGPAYGKIIKANGDPLENAAILVFFDNSYPLLSISKSTGEWLVPLNNILNKDTLKNQTVDSKTKLRIDIYDENMDKTSIQADLSSITPLPQTVIIGKDYSFFSNNNVLSVVSNNFTVANNVEITFPKDMAVIPGDKPLIKGLGVAQKEVKISIDPPKGFSTKTIVDNQGEWKIVLNNPLSSGNHVLTISTFDQNGKTVVMTRNFIIAKSGEQVMGIATVEATPTSMAYPTSTPLPTYSTSPYITLSATVTPPTSGIDIIPVSVTSASLIILGLGMLMVF